MRWDCSLVASWIFQKRFMSQHWKRSSKPDVSRAMAPSQKPRNYQSRITRFTSCAGKLHRVITTPSHQWSQSEEKQSQSSFEDTRRGSVQGWEQCHAHPGHVSRADIYWWPPPCWPQAPVFHGIKRPVSTSHLSVKSSNIVPLVHMSTILTVWWLIFCTSFLS